MPKRQEQVDKKDNARKDERRGGQSAPTPGREVREDVRDTWWPQG